MIYLKKFNESISIYHNSEISREVYDKLRDINEVGVDRFDSYPDYNLIIFDTLFSQD
jgi:hypothetical protein